MKERLQNIPQQPGVYLFKDHKGNIIYVGKAKILRNRIRSYFQAPKNLDPKVRVMMTKVMDLDFIVTNTEVEALILENNLIKEYQPRYNIALRDDKTYPYLKITLGDRFPRICIVREEKDGISKYFGPYTDVVSLRETVKTLTSIFPLRTCRLLKQQNRPCLNRDMGKCLAPCSGQVSAEEYRRVVEDLVAVMEGNAGDIILKLDQEMREAAKHQEFEKAARLRDQIAGIKRIGERQEVVLSSPLNLDIIGLVADPAESLALVFKIRAGKILAKDTFWLHAAINEEPAEIAGFFIKHYYSENADIPPEILINQLPQEPGLIQAWLAKSRGAHVKLKSPRQGEKKRMLNMALYNARLLWEEKTQKDHQVQEKLLLLSRVLNLEVIPRRIECFDISHSGGTDTVASMAVFEDGQPAPKQYRHFKIRRDQNDDFASLAEAVKRRFLRAREGDPSFSPEPDLLIIDGQPGSPVFLRW
jgi:excinuclease ABC subunit C